MKTTQAPAAPDDATALRDERDATGHARPSSDAVGDAPTDRGPAPSPCVGVCRIVESEARCAGCLRTLDEIARWSRLDDPARHALLDELRDRRRSAASTTAPS